VEDYVCGVHPVVEGFPSAGEFQRKIVRELKIRCYRPKTLKTYKNALCAFLRWFGAKPHKVSREDVRNYLELLVDGGASSSWVSVQLSVIRTVFDKMCGRQVTLGLMTPRRPKRLPVVPSREEVVRILKAATSLRDKLLIGLMYAAGLRVSEVVRLCWRDVDFDRRVINVWQGKGRTDRLVTLPVSFEPLLRELAKNAEPGDFLFPGDRKGRYIAPRTAQRAVQRAVRLAGIGKRITPHSFRHGFACHLLEDDTDIRFIQQLLGHVRLETTRIYTKVAVLKDKPVVSPLDRLLLNDERPSSSEPKAPVGRMRLELQLRPPLATRVPTADVKIVIVNNQQPVRLPGVVVQEARPGWITLEVPPIEAWEEPLSVLSSSQRQRIESPEFYETLQRHIGRRFLALIN
jgi:site-specific recombinase XerD